MATIEVKSNLTQAEFANAASAAKNCKMLVSNTIESFRTGYIPPKVLNYVVAYEGPASMKTVHGWVSREYSKLGIGEIALPLDKDQRVSQAAEAIDAVFVLGKGFLYFDNVPIGFANAAMGATTPGCNWVFGDKAAGNLLLLFLMIQGATANIEGRWLNAIPYLSNFQT